MPARPLRTQLLLTMLAVSPLFLANALHRGGGRLEAYEGVCRKESSRRKAYRGGCQMPDFRPYALNHF